MNEADTCRTYVIPKLKTSGWEDEYITEQLVLTPGRIVPIGDQHTRKEGLRPKYNALRELQPQTQEELNALSPSVLDKAFRGEL
jgi:hypothetical protein